MLRLGGRKVALSGLRRLAPAASALSNSQKTRTFATFKPEWSEEYLAYEAPEPNYSWADKGVLSKFDNVEVFPDNKEWFKHSLIRKYGAVPCAAFLGSALLTKQLFIFDAYMLYGLEFSLFWGLVYVATGDGYHGMVKENADKEANAYENVMDLMLDRQRAQAELLKFNMAIPDLIQSNQQRLDGLMGKKISSDFEKVRAEAGTNAITLLQTLRDSKSEGAAAAETEFFDTFLAEVYSRMQKDEKLQKQWFDQCLKLMDDKAPVPKNFAEPIWKKYWSTYDELQAKEKK